MSKIIRAVGYPRYSSDNQSVESINAQVKAIENYCKQKGYILVDLYPDEAKTATSDNRPQFQKMITDSAKGLFDVVVVHKLDRFARDRYDSAMYKRVLKKNGVRVDSVLENLDGSPESVILESMLEGMAEYFSLNLAREVRKGMEENAASGKHAGGTAPYGLKVNKETLKYEIDQKTYKAVQYYFESVVRGIPLPDIATHLNEQGYRTPNGKLFKNTSFSSWASNQKYKGDYTWDVSIGRSEEKRSMKKRDTDKQKIIRGIIPAIVTEELWERVNALKEPRKHRGAEMKANITYLLSGKVICGNPECKTHYAGTSYLRGIKRYNYYRCLNKCGNTGVNKEELEQIVVEQVIERCFSEEGIVGIINRIQSMYREKQNSSVDEAGPIKQELAELDIKINNWAEAVGNGVKTFIEKVITAEQRKAALEYELKKLEIVQKVTVLNEKEIRRMLEQKKNDLRSDDESKKKAALQECVESVTVLHAKDKLEIDLTVRFFDNAGEASLLIYLHLSIDRQE
jgi:site-specific DNA recombinase